ncbi:hypothetical protein WFJ45_24450, partial [Salmonella enterica subsp. enterica serovar Minnesota]|uniref:hypothetical protein n=1 Tax=Salmonella enterica TaxID=28901 RepID=UPI003D2D6218
FRSLGARVGLEADHRFFHPRNAARVFGQRLAEKVGLEAARAGGFVYLDCDTPSGDAKAVWSTVEPALDFSRNLRYG